MQVVDIAFDRPLKTDRIFVDTNVWLFVCYEKATFGLDQARQRVVDWYIRYVGRAKSLGAELVTFPTVLFEIARHIEHAEYFEACRVKGVEPFTRQFSLKTWRSEPAARHAMTESTRFIWSEILSRATAYDANLRAARSGELFDATAVHSIDIGDAVHRQLSLDIGVTQVLSDDMDFLDPSSPIVLLTQNPKALSEAAAQNILVRR
jgi:hypothetical protein